MENIQDKVEDNIIDWIALGSGGRLVAFKPEKGYDLVVQKKGGYKEKEFYLKIESFAPSPENKNFVKDIPLSDFKALPNFYFVFAVFNEIKQKTEEKFWLIPSVEFKGHFDSDKSEKFLADKNSFNNLLIEKLILENRPGPKIGFQHRQY